MHRDRVNGVLHQMLLMSRDPVIYLAIDEHSGGFSQEESLTISVVKASALTCSFRLDEALKLALDLDKKLKQEDLLILEIFNLFTIIAIYRILGNRECFKSYTDEAYIRAQGSSDEMLKALAATYNIDIMQPDPLQLDPLIDDLSQKVAKAEHPYFRICLLSWLGKIHQALSHHDKAQDFFSAAYDLSSQHQMSIISLKLCISLIQSCTELGKHEMAESFYAIAHDLIAQLRLPVYEMALNLDYGVLKHSIGDHHAAVLFFHRSLQAATENQLDLPLLKFDVLRKLANCLKHVDSNHEALSYQLEAEKMIAGKGFLELEKSLSAQIADSLIAEGNYDEAIRRLKDAANYYRQNNKIPELTRTMRSMAEFFRKKQDFQEGFAVLTELDKLNQSYINHLHNSHSKDSDQKLKDIIKESKSLRHKYEALLRDVVKRQATRFIGNSKSAKRVIDSAILASMHREANVLIIGQSGTGKEVLAQMIHYSSPQKNEAFVTVNCAAISASLFDVHFFGAAAGQFTGAEKERKGLFEIASGGSIYIDEISELPLDFQAKLLRALDTKSYSPVGKDIWLPLDCKIIASTQKDTLTMLEKNEFRLDLLHRLNTLEIHIPPLKDRMEDIPLLVENFSRTFARETNKRLPQIKDSFYGRLTEYPFPGNVRELKNIIERIFILYYEPVWTADTLDNIDAYKRDRQLHGYLIEHNIKDLDRDRIIEALAKTGGKQKTAAKLLNMSESTLCRKIKKYKIK